MNATGAGILINPYPRGHLAYSYTDEGSISQAVALFTNAGLAYREGVILILEADHCDAIKLRLQWEGINVETFELSGQLICVTAEEVLAGFLCDGVLDGQLFKSTVGHLIERAKTGKGPPRRVRIYGEILSRLRGRDLTATRRLEELWNEVIQEHSVAVLCGYAMNGAPDRFPEVLIDLHSHHLEGGSAVSWLGHPLN